MKESIIKFDKNIIKYLKSKGYKKAPRYDFDVTHIYIYFSSEKMCKYYALLNDNNAEFYINKSSIIIYNVLSDEKKFKEIVKYNENLTEIELMKTHFKNFNA